MTLRRELLQQVYKLLGEGEGGMVAVGDSKWLQEQVWICESGGSDEEGKDLLLDSSAQFIVPL